MLGFLPIARTTFDIPFAEQKTADALTHLRAAFGDDLIAISELVTDSDGLNRAVATLRGLPFDLLIVFQATFADSSVVTALAEQLPDVPLLLWALPEPQVGGRLRLNSFCGINLAAFALKRRNIRYTYLYTDPTPAAIETVDAAAKAGRALRLLRGSRIGVVGQHPAGFEPCAYDADGLQMLFGAEVYPYDLEAVFAKADAVSAERVTAQVEAVRGRLSNLDSLNAAQVRGTLSFYEAARDLVGGDGLKALAVRCWPETFLKRDCAICAASSLLTESGTPATCEADVNGAVSGVIAAAVSGEPAFSADLVGVDVAANTGTFWHCGLAPLSMCDPEFAPRGALHSNRQKPLLMEFPLKPGRVSIFRLTQAGASGRYRLVIGTGEMLRAPMQFTGTSGLLRFDSPAQHVLDTIMDEGLDHHFTLLYGDSKPLEYVAAFTGLPVIRL
jgi:L-fucose isomerase-like protein